MGEEEKEDDEEKDKDENGDDEENEDENEEKPLGFPPGLLSMRPLSLRQKSG